ncbi:hypothetical protein B0T25DRAFT_573295 [Lasiosphaeria hispida]|uniref:C2H2-type domain-containing protein n=1 Tax=Lasiosphaeria hispida TaxID=260671 RepID=A0AAJ0H9M4_9PEZI|nr:hypothetical protein B0T25DRAFT_573295 [Lasiosphaeria hispida]
MELPLKLITMGTTGLEFDDGQGFGFDSQALGFPPSSAHSFSSASSSGPYTPTSGRSTPRNADSVDFSSSFASSVDPFSFDLTPPSSASISTFFPVEWKTGDACDFFQTGLPITPSRSHMELSGLPYNNYDNQYTPAQPFDLYPFANGLGPSPLPPTPVQVVQVKQEWDQWSNWDHVQESPISFEELGGFEKHGMTDLVGAVGRRLFTDTVKEKTTALQRVQNDSSLRARKRARPEKLMNVPFKKEGKNENFCHYPGCDRKYKKKEHLKRHVDSAHKEAKHECSFCGRIFNRTDNRKQHLLLHSVDRKSGRVRFEEGAAEKLEAEMKQTKPRRGTKAKARAAACS